MCALWTKNAAKPSVKQQRAERTERILSDAVDQRAKINLTMEAGITNLKTISASITSFNNNAVALEVSSLKSASSSFVGSRVSAYFRIRERENKGRTVFLQFQSRITDVKASPAGLVHFVIDRPEDVVEAQQRRCVRVEVNESRVSPLHLWRELPPKAVVDEREPLATSANAPDSELRLANLSTTGLRFVVKNAAMNAIFPELRKGSCFTVRFKALLEDEMDADFLVNAVLRNGFNDLEKKETSLGFEFTAEAVYDDEGQLKWEPLRTGEVSDLGVFILKWNLQDFYNEQRVDE